MRKGGIILLVTLLVIILVLYLFLMILICYLNFFPQPKEEVEYEFSL